MLSAFCARGEDRTHYLSACSPTLYPLSYPVRLHTVTLCKCEDTLALSFLFSVYDINVSLLWNRVLQLGRTHTLGQNSLAGTKIDLVSSMVVGIFDI
jgi:hypothetical protein